MDSKGAKQGGENSRLRIKGFVLEIRELVGLDGQSMFPTLLEPCFSGEKP